MADQRLREVEGEEPAPAELKDLVDHWVKVIDSWVQHIDQGMGGMVEVEGADPGMAPGSAPEAAGP